MKKNNENPLLSVIIPVYNTEEFLPECLDSIVNQTYKNIEIICIDDKSTDSSLNILDKYAHLDERFFIVKKKQNTGCGDTRDIGMKFMRGKYVIFIDSDDYIDKDYFEKLINKLEKTNRDMARGYVDFVDYKEKTAANPISNLKIRFAPWTLNIKDFFPLWTHMFRASYIKENKIYFKYRYFEDTYYYCRLKMHSPKVTYVNDSFYHYRKRVGVSLSYECYAKTENINQMIAIFEDLFECSSNICAKKYKELLVNIFYNIEFMIIQVEQKDEEYKKEFFEILKKFYSSHKEFESIENKFRFIKALKDNDREKFFAKKKKTFKTRCANFIYFKFIRPIHNNLLPKNLKGLYKLPDKTDDKLMV